MDRLSLQERYNHNYQLSDYSDKILTNVKKEIGRVDANNEWEDEKEAVSNFIKLDAYEDFSAPDVCYIVGRYGTGKSAIMNRLEHAVNNKGISCYHHVVHFDSEKSLREFTSTIRTAGLNDTLIYDELKSKMRANWELAVQILAMKKVYDVYGSCVPKIKKYLEICNEIASGKLETFVLNIFKVAPEVHNNLATKTLKAIAEALENTDPTYLDAVEELKNTLVNNCERLLIMFDSIESYAYNDQVSLACIQALIDTCSSYTNCNHLCVKMAVPSELVPYLTGNIEKFDDIAAYIEWSYSDLKRFIALRYYKAKNKLTGVVDEDTAVKFFDTHFDHLCTTYTGISFPTFPYILTMTQRKPRELIQIFNNLITLENKYPSKKTNEILEAALQNGIAKRITGAFQIYRGEEKSIYNLFESTFKGHKYCFSLSEFDQWKKICDRKTKSISSDDLMKLFISSGLVGVQKSLNYIDTNHPTFQNGNNVIRFKEVFYEYQLKAQLGYNSNTRFCLHPMCYKLLGIEIDKNTFAYPVPVSEDDFSLDKEYTH